MNGGIYLDDGGELLEMTEETYSQEALLQRDLADFPKLLAGDQMDTREPRQWALVAREASVPDENDGNERWSADHLFVDQDAIPTIVEVKRSEDTRRRREVAGQMLDYASHAAHYWEAEDLQGTFGATCEERELMPEEVLAGLVDADDPPEDFWTQVESNLRSGHVRLLFVADDIPNELKRIVEFLNEQMSAAEVLAVEVTQYTCADRTAYVPRLYGQTEEARQSRQSTTRPNHDEDDFLHDVAEKERDGELTAGEATTLRDLYRFVRNEADDYDFGGTANVSVTARWDALGGSNGMFTISAAGGVKFWQPKNTHEPGETPWSREDLEEWYEAIAALPTVSKTPENLYENPKFPVEVLTDESVREQFESACLEFAAACERARD